MSRGLGTSLVCIHIYFFVVLPTFSAAFYNHPSTDYFDMYRFVEQRRLRQVCTAYAQSNQSGPDTHTRRMEVEERSDKKCISSFDGYASLDISKQQCFHFFLS